MCSATIEPASRRNSTSANPARRISAGELLGGREARDRGRQVGVGGAAGQQPPEQRDDPVEPEREERAQHAARPRDLEDREPAAGAEHAPELAQPALEVGDVADPEADRRRVERARRRTAARAGRPRPTRASAPCAAPARASAREKSRPVTVSAPAAQIGEREVAGAAGGVEDAVAGLNGRGGREPPPAQVEPDGHHAVHRVVDRGDPVEHRPDGVRRERHSPKAYAQARVPRALLAALGRLEERREAQQVLRCPGSRSSASGCRRSRTTGTSGARSGRGCPCSCAPSSERSGAPRLLVAGAEVGVAVQAADRGEQLRARDRGRVVREALLLRPRPGRASRSPTPSASFAVAPL